MPMNVTVASAASTGSATAPVVASRPEGTSQASTRGRVRPSVLAWIRRTSSAGASRSPPRPPVPSIPSMTRSAPAAARAQARAPASPSSRMKPRAARRAASPSSWAPEPVSTAVTRAPRPRSRAPACRASPPLFPEPARTTTSAP